MQNAPDRIVDTQWAALREVVSGLSTLFWGPTSDTCRQLIEGPFLGSLELLAPLMQVDPPDVLDQLHTLLSDVTDGDSLFQSLESDYVSLFINDRGGITAPLYASCYDSEDPRLMGEPALLMKQRFESKRLAQDDNIGEPADHLSIELEFLYFLLSQENADSDPSTEAADFATEAMLPWIRSFHEKIEPVAQLRFYPLLSAILVGVLDMISGLGEGGN